MGHFAVYGIYFDTDKAEIKPESEPALAEMTKLLKDNPSLNVFIVGHTDSTGTFEHNLTLSMDRASAVVNALVSGHGIAAARLKPYGWRRWPRLPRTRPRTASRRTGASSWWRGRPSDGGAM